MEINRRGFLRAAALDAGTMAAGCATGESETDDDVCPDFEEDRARELLQPAFGDEVRVWQEEESPSAVIAGIVKDRGVEDDLYIGEDGPHFFSKQSIAIDQPFG